MGIASTMKKSIELVTLSLNSFETIYLKVQLENLTLLTADGVKNRHQGFGFRPLTAVFYPVSGSAFLSA